MFCYCCERSDGVMSLPKLGDWEHLRCPECGEYKISDSLVAEFKRDQHTSAELREKLMKLKKTNDIPLLKTDN